MNPAYLSELRAYAHYKLTHDQTDLGQPVAVYTYCASKSPIAYLVVRWLKRDGSKTFTQHRLDPQRPGKLIAGLGDTPALPYNLIAIEAAQNKRVVFLVEGEKDADAGSAIGLLTTCNNGGAGKWGAVQSAYLKGAHVCLLPDNDRAGRDHVAKALNALSEAGATSVRCVELPGASDKGDLSDYLASGGTKDALRKLYDAAPNLLAHNLDTWLIAPPTPRTAYTAPRSSNSNDDIELARLALANLGSWRAVEFSDWANVGMALYHVSPSLLSDWDSWSASSTHYKERACAAQWRTFKTDRSQVYALGSLIHWAIEDTGRSWLPHNHPERALETDLVSPTIQSSGMIWSNGLPDGARAAMNKDAPSQFAPLCEVWCEAVRLGYVKWDKPVNYEYLKCLSDSLGYRLSESSIRRAMKLGPEQFLSKWAHTYISNTKIEESTESCESELIPRVGRPSEYYTFRTPDEIIAELCKRAIERILKETFPQGGDILAPVTAAFVAQLDVPIEQLESVTRELNEKYHELIEAQPGFAAAMQRARNEYKRLRLSLRDTTSTTLELKFSNHAEYVAAFARAIVSKFGGDTRMSRAELCAKIGCKDATLSKYLKAGGVEVLKDQFKEVPIRVLKDIWTTKRTWNNIHEGYLVGVNVTGKAVYRFEGSDLDKVGWWVKKAMDAGRAVNLVYQQCNRQRLIAPWPAMPPEGEPPAKAVLIVYPCLAVRLYRAARRLILVGWWIAWLKKALRAKPKVQDKRITKPRVPYGVAWANGTIALAGRYDTAIKLPGDVALQVLKAGIEVEDCMSNFKVETMEAIRRDPTDDPLILAQQYVEALGDNETQSAIRNYVAAFDDMNYKIAWNIEATRLIKERTLSG